MRCLLACIFVLATFPARADDDELRQKIIGSWKLVSVLYENQQTNERTPVLGEHPRGRQIATRDGLWLALVTGEGRSIYVRIGARSVFPDHQRGWPALALADSGDDDEVRG